MSAFVKVLQVHQALYEHSGGLIGHRLLGGMPTVFIGNLTGRAAVQIQTLGTFFHFL